MNSQSEVLGKLGNFDEFIVKAFVIALYKFDQSLSPKLNTKINTVAQAWLKGDVKQVKKFIAIAQENPDFNKTFTTAYDELTKLNDDNEKSKYLSGIIHRDPDFKPENISNYLAPCLADSNPQNAIKIKLAEVGSNIVQWIFQQKL